MTEANTNKDKAFKMLKSRLYELELEKREAENAGIEKSNIGWEVKYV